MKIIILTMTLCALSFADIGNTQKLDTDSDKVQFLWSYYITGDLDAIHYQSIKREINLSSLNRIELIKIQEIDSAFGSKKGFKKIKSDFSLKESVSIVSELNNFKNLSITLSSKQKEAAHNYLDKISKNQNPTISQLNDLIVNTPDYAHYKNGEYHNKLKVFMFCRNDRNFPCRMVLKDIFNNFVTNDDGSIWSIPTLALSKYALPYNVTNGSTPTGVHLMNSVMPEANRQNAFGKFRRVILDWVASSEKDVDMKHFLPESSHKSLWWKQASVSRDNGRHYLRIHGTGLINNDETLSYYPHIPTSGCISTLEGQYQENYIDQRKLLDKMMKAMQLAPVYTNETDIKGVLYVINLDNEKSAVSEKDLKKLAL